MGGGSVEDEKGKSGGKKKTGEKESMERKRREWERK